MFFANYLDYDGYLIELEGDSVEDIANQLPETCDTLSGIEVRDEAGWIRGWVYSPSKWKVA